jgi:hypothetical protein
MARPKTAWAENPTIPRCGRLTAGGDPCRWQAGHGTDHLGIGPCVFHEGRGEPFDVERAMRESREAAEEVERRQERLTRLIAEDGEDDLLVESSRVHKAWRDLDVARRRMVRIANAVIRFAPRQEETQ